MRRCHFLLPLLLLHWLPAQELPAPLAVPRVQAVPLPHFQTSFQLDGQELTACHYDPADMRPFWYPLLTTTGRSLTRMGHPHDPLTHSHHNSVWISHNKVNGLDFWGDMAKAQGRILCHQIPREAYTDSDECATMQMVNHWVKAEDQSLQMIETRRTEVRPVDGRKSWFLIIDLEYTAPAGKPAVIEPSFFGLVAVRVAKSMGVRDGGGRILNSEGQLNEAQVFRKPARWVDYGGRLTNDAEGMAGITLMNHPQNPSNPTPFHVRDDGWVGCCLIPESPEVPKGQPREANPPALQITAEQPLRLRYGLWVHDGLSTQVQSEEHWQRFTALPLADLELTKKK
jgi:hypothetical protein